MVQANVAFGAFDAQRLIEEFKTRDWVSIIRQYEQQEAGQDSMAGNFNENQASSTGYQIRDPKDFVTTNAGQVNLYQYTSVRQLSDTQFEFIHKDANKNMVVTKSVDDDGSVKWEQLP